MPQVGVEYFEGLRETIERIRNAVWDEKQSLLKSNPSWDINRDARVTSLNKIINVLSSAQLAFLFIATGLMKTEWWRNVVKETVSQSDMVHYTKEFAMFSKIALLNFSFSSMESSLRVFLRAIDPVACRQGTDDFKNIYDCLLGKLSSPSPNARQLLDLLRIGRNTIHNNGVYFHKSGGDADVIYKGTTYSFGAGQPVDFLTWELILQLIDDACRLLVAMISDPKISGIQGLLLDPYAPANLTTP